MNINSRIVLKIVIFAQPSYELTKKLIHPSRGIIIKSKGILVMMVGGWAEASLEWKDFIKHSHLLALTTKPIRARNHDAPTYFNTETILGSDGGREDKRCGLVSW